MKNSNTTCVNCKIQVSEDSIARMHPHPECFTCYSNIKIDLNNEDIIKNLWP